MAAETRVANPPVKQSTFDPLNQTAFEVPIEKVMRVYDRKFNLLGGEEFPQHSPVRNEIQRLKNAILLNE